MANERKRKLQLWRNSINGNNGNNPFPNLEEAKAAMKRLQGSDGEIALARYNFTGGEGANAITVIKSVMGVYSDDGNGNTYWTFLQDVAASEGSAEAIQSELDDTQTGAGLNADGSYTPDSENDIIGSSESISDAVDDLANYVVGLDFDSMTQDASEVVTLVTQENGQIDVDTTTVTDLELTGFVEDANADGDVDENDTLESAFNKINNRLGGIDTAIGNMDSTVSTAVNNGDVVTKVVEADGVVTVEKANLSDVLLTGYSKTADTGAIAATDSVEVALSKLENKVSDVDSKTITSVDSTVVVTPGNNGATDLAVNIDGTTLVKANDGTLSTNLSLVQLSAAEVTALNDTNVKEAYKLIYATDSNRTAIGNVIKVWKDSALQEAYIGDSTDRVSAGTGDVTKYVYYSPSYGATPRKYTQDEYDAMTPEEKKGCYPIDLQYLNFVYQYADGTYGIVHVDISKFLTENEFGNGLAVVNGVVSVKIDENSERVTLSDGQGGTTTVPVLSVSSDGVMIDHIQDAIDYSIENNIVGNMPIEITTRNGVTSIAFVIKNHVDGQDSNDLITIDANDGFILGTTWDCGEYAVEEP